MAGNTRRRLVASSLYPLFLVLSIISLFVLLPTRVHASEPCGQPALTATGFYFSSYESIEHTSDGFPILHLKNRSTYSEPTSFTLYWSMQTDECQHADVNIYSVSVVIPAGVSDWSIRFTSPTHFDIWDDQNAVVLASQDILTYPQYYRIAFFGSTLGSASTFSSQQLMLVDGTTPPVRTDGVERPDSCPGPTVLPGYFFDDTYEHAEYVDGLLRIHLRLKVPYNDGRFFSSRALTRDETCGHLTSSSNLNILATHLTPYTRYYSFRMTSPTHFELWDDERNVKFDCADCQGDIPEDTPFVQWFGYLDGGASYYISTPFAPTQAVQGCQTDCVSNILFLPGFQSSRLYTQTNGSENQLWEPGILSLQGDAKKLNLKEDGTSINQVYAKQNGVIDFIDVPFGNNIQVYKSFLTQLQNLESTQMIVDHGVFAYDWRMSVTDIVEHGTQYADGTHFVTDEVERLAASSKTGKVTIVAHSNGGLLAKALTQRLENENTANLVDKILFVGTPQLGTPKTVASMLNGDFQNFPGGAGFIVSKETARELAKNMPGAYGLLPSSAYFSKVATPVVTMTDAPNLMNVSGITDSTIDDFAPFTSFLTSSTRPNPPASDVEKPLVLSDTLFNDASTMHNSLDSWTPPAGVEAIQIVGWGLDTPSGITYTEKKHYVCPTLSGCFETTDIKHSIDMTEDGDGTVVAASAAANTSLPTYYINIPNLNESLRSKFSHASLTETPSFGEFFSNLISTTSITSLPSFIESGMPGPNQNGKMLHLRVLSPVSLDAYDIDGNHTGLVSDVIPVSDLQFKEEDIPNSYYEEFGEGKYIGLPAEGTYQVNLVGLDLGTFTLEIKTTGGGEPDTIITYKDIPVTASSTGTLVVAGEELEQTTFTLDVNGDGVKETIPASGAVVTDPLTYIGLIKESVQTMSLGTKTKKQLLAKLSNTQLLLRRSEKWDEEDDDGRESHIKRGERLDARIVKKIDKIGIYIQKQLARSDKKSKKNESIDQQQAAELLTMLATLKSLVQ